MGAVDTQWSMDRRQHGATRRSHLRVLWPSGVARELLLMVQGPKLPSQRGPTLPDMRRFLVEWALPKSGAM